MYDVIVIGGGPSGLNTARTLAENGLDVIVLERKSRIGQNVLCTGIVGNNIFNEFQLPDSSIISKIQKVNMISPYRTSILYDHPQPFACVVDREKFDRNIAGLAVQAGSRIDCEKHVKNIQINGKGIEVSASNNGNGSLTYKARMAVIATGVNNQLSRKIGLGCSQKFINGAQLEVEADNLPDTHIFFGNKIAPGAFAWAVPARDRIRIGLITEKDPKPYFKNLLKSVLPKAGAGVKKQFHLKAIVQGVVSRTYANRVLVVGEAAGQVKTTTGGGIYFGLQGSRDASDVILRNIRLDRLSAKALSEYEKQWKKNIHKEILIGYYARKICSRLSDSKIEKLFSIARNNGIIPFIKQNGNFDWHGQLILGLARKTLVFQNLLNKF